jgi:hypothetical protein
MKSKSRRDSLKIIGAVGSTCAFPFSADTLYGQHTHPAPGTVQIAPAGPYKSKNFGEGEFAVISRLADLIIPPTDTPGAVAAGVPQYIDEVVTANPGHKQRFRAGIARLDSAASAQFGKKFLELDESQQIAILKPLHDAADSFFVLVKNMTADGYYTSHAGLVEELGYKGNTVLSAFPECNHPEHHG